MPDTYKVDGGFGDEWHSNMWDYIRPQLVDAYWGDFNTALTAGHYPADVPPPQVTTLTLPTSILSLTSGVFIVTADDEHIYTEAPPADISLPSTTVLAAPTVSTGSLVAEPPIEEFATISGGAVVVGSPVVTGGLTVEAPPEVTVSSPAVTTTTDTTTGTLVAEAPPEVSITSDAIRRPGDASDGTFEAFPPVDITISGPFAISSPPLVTSGFIYVEDTAGNVTVAPDVVNVSGSTFTIAAAQGSDPATGGSDGSTISFADGYTEDPATPIEILDSAGTLYQRLWQIVHRMKLKDRDQ